MLSTSICAISLVLITPMARGDETTVQQSNTSQFLNPMTGDGPYGSVEMGEMFSMLKVRADLALDDYSGPGWYKHPEGHQPYEYNGELLELSKQLTPCNSLMGLKSQFASAHFKAV